MQRTASSSVPTGAEVSTARTVGSVSPELICFWVSIKGLKRSSSKAEPDSAIDYAPFERCPGVHSPTSIKVPIWSNEGIEARLPDIGKILSINKQTYGTDASLDEHAE